MDKKIMVAGHISLDITPKFPDTLKGSLSDILVPGTLINIEKATIGTGGAVSNTGLVIDKLGVTVLLNGKIGDDEFGSIVKQLVGPQKTKFLRTVSDINTSYTIVVAPPGIDRMFLHDPGANNTFGADDIDYDALADCYLFHFGYPCFMERIYQNDGKELVEMYKNVKNLNVTTALDMGLPDPSSQAGQADWTAILKDVIPFVDVFVPSIEEITYMLDRPLFEQRKTEAGGDDPVLAYKPADFAAISDMLLDMGAKVILLKSGINGCYLRTTSADRIKQLGKACPSEVNAWADKELWAASYKTDKFGSATGAGDAAIAGFLVGIVRDFSAADSLLLANTVAMQNVRGIDTLSGIEDWPATLAMLKDKTRPRHPLKIDGDGWEFNEQLGLLEGPYNKGNN